MKKTGSKLLVLFLALVMTLSVVIPALAADGDPMELTITNNTGMFKAETARLETVDGQEYLVVALSGSGYHYLYKGTYAEAVANGDATENWIAGEQVDGKWTFRIPVSADEG